MQPEYVDQRPTRLDSMDEQGVEAILLFPTLAVCVEHFLKHDADLLYANLHTFNRWLDDDWGFDHTVRSSRCRCSRCSMPTAPSPSSTSCSPPARGRWACGPARVRPLTCRPGLRPALGTLNEARIPVCFHIGESGYNELFSTAWGEEANPSSHQQSAFQWTSFYGDRPIMDTLSALVLHNLFGRFPNIRCISVENGSLFVPYLLKVMNKMNGMGRNGPWLGGRITERPSDIFRRHVYVSPYHEEDVVTLAELIGDDHVLFGSDYPHAEGLAEPRDFLECIASLGRRRATDHPRQPSGPARLQTVGT